MCSDCPLRTERERERNEVSFFFIHSPRDFREREEGKESKGREREEREREKEGGERGIHQPASCNAFIAGPLQRSKFSILYPI